MFVPGSLEVNISYVHMAISKRLDVINLAVSVVIKPHGAGKLPTFSPDVSSVSVSPRRGTCSIQP
jgi:hypothetical protein